jgi:hypothetical protein
MMINKRLIHIVEESKKYNTETFRSCKCQLLLFLQKNKKTVIGLTVLKKLNDDTDQAATSLIDNPLHRLLQLLLGVIRHTVKFILNALPY